GEQRVRAQLEGDGRRGQREAGELLARDAEDEIGLALGAGEIEREPRARRAAMLERKQEALRTRAPPARGALELGEHAAQRERERLDPLGLGGELEPCAEARRRH